jgi:hypothetical protein
MGRVWLAALAGIVALTAGCSDDAEPETESDNQSLRVAAVGVSFEVPASWQVVDPERLKGNNAQKELLQPAADAAGVPIDEFVQQSLANYDLYLVDTEARGELANTMSVFITKSGFPEDSQLEQALVETLGATVGQILHVQTAFGDTVSLEFELPTSISAEPLQGRSLWIPADKPVSITVSSPDRALTDALAQQVLDTLEKG